MLKPHQNVQTHPNRREEKSDIIFFADLFKWMFKGIVFFTTYFETTTKQGSNSMTPPVSKIIQFRVGYRLLNKMSEAAIFFTGVASIWSKQILKFHREEDLFISLSKDLFILYVLFLQYRSCDNTLEDCFFQILSYSHSYAKTKGEVPLGPLLGKQNIQEKDVYCIF